MKSLNKLKTNALIIILVAILAFSLPVLAQTADPPPQETLALNDQQGQYLLGRWMDVLEDPDGKLTIEQVSSPQFAPLFVRSQADMPNLGFTGSAYWIRLNLNNQAAHTSWWLEVSFPPLNYVDLYTPLGSGQGFEVKKSGTLRPVSTRDIPYQHVVLGLPLPVGSPQTVYLRIQTDSSMTLGLTLWAPAAFMTQALTSQALLGIYFGALLAILIYNLFLLISLKDINYLYMVLILTGIIVVLADWEGFSNIFFDLFAWRMYIQGYAIVLLFISLLLFTGSFLQISTYLPKLRPVLIAFVAVWAGTALLILFLPDRTVLVLISLFMPITIVFVWALSVAAWSMGKSRPAFIFMCAWVWVAIGLVALSLSRLGFLPNNPVIEYGYWLAFVWMALFWSFALADRVHLLKAETEAANQELENNQRQMTKILDGLPIGVLVYGQDRNLNYLNRRASEILSKPGNGGQPDPAVGQSASNPIRLNPMLVTGSQEEYPPERLPVTQAFEGKDAMTDDIEADLIDRRVQLESWASPLRNEQGEIELVVAAVLDITQRKKDEAELNEHRHHLEQLVNDRTAQFNEINKQLHNQIVERQRLEDSLRLRLEWLVTSTQANQSVIHPADLAQVYQKFSEIIQKMFGAEAAFIAEMESVSLGFIIRTHATRKEDGADWVDAKIRLPAGISHHLQTQGEQVILTGDELGGLGDELGAYFQGSGSTFILLAPIRFQDRVMGLLGLEYREAERFFSINEQMLITSICADIEQIKERAWLFEQTQALVAAEERDRLGRDLHDSVTQVLFAASLVAEVLPQIWRRDPVQAEISLQELRRLTRGALAEMRTMLLELRPSAVIKTPLSDLLSQLTEAVTSRTGLPYQLYIEQIPTLPEDVHIAFYRIAQESLNNIVKHAFANHVEVSLSKNPPDPDAENPLDDEVVLVVRDDGRGFLIEEQGDQHMGLGIMRERAEAIHARISVDSEPGKGTTVTLIWQDQMKGT